MLAFCIKFLNSNDAGGRWCHSNHCVGGLWCKQAQLGLSDFFAEASWKSFSAVSTIADRPLRALFFFFFSQIGGTSNGIKQAKSVSPSNRQSTDGGRNAGKRNQLKISMNTFSLFFCNFLQFSVSLWLPLLFHFFGFYTTVTLLLINYIWHKL